MSVTPAVMYQQHQLYNLPSSAPALPSSSAGGSREVPAAPTTCINTSDNANEGSPEGKPLPSPRHLSPETFALKHGGGDGTPSDTHLGILLRDGDTSERPVAGVGADEASTNSEPADSREGNVNLLSQQVPLGGIPDHTRSSGAGVDNKGKRRKSPKWPSASRETLADIILDVKPWRVAEDRRSVDQKWEVVWGRLMEPPTKAMFESKSPKLIRSYFDLMLKNKRNFDTIAGEQLGPPSSSFDAEEARMDALMSKIVDKIFVDKEAIRLKNADIELAASQAALESIALSSGTPTPLEPASAPQPGLASQLSGGSSSGGSASRSSQVPSSDDRRSVKPVGALADYFVNKDYDVDWADIQEKVVGTRREMELFTDKGWKEGDLSPLIAANLFTEMLVALGNFCPGGPDGGRYKGGKRDWAGEDWDGLGAACVGKICEHYGASLAELEASTDPWYFSCYNEGWRGNDLPWEEVDKLNRTFANMLVAGPTYQASNPAEDGTKDPNSANGDQAQQQELRAGGEASSGRKKRKACDLMAGYNLARTLSGIARGMREDASLAREQQLAFRREDRELRRIEREEDRAERELVREEERAHRQGIIDETARVAAVEVARRAYEIKMAELKFEKMKPVGGASAV